MCAGGSTVDAKTFLTQLWEQIHVGGALGNATGRNLHQRELGEAVRLTQAISAITLGDYATGEPVAELNLANVGLLCLDPKQVGAVLQ